MTPPEKAFAKWWAENYPGQDADESGTDFYLRIFEAGWWAATTGREGEDGE